MVGGKTTQFRRQLLPRVPRRLPFAVFSGPEDRTALPDARLKAGKLPLEKFDVGKWPHNFVIPYLFSLFRIKNITPGETMQVRGDMIKKKKTPIT